MLLRYPDVPIGDPVRKAAMYEARARAALAEAAWHERHGNAQAALVFGDAADRDVRTAREILEATASAEHDVAP